MIMIFHTLMLHKINMLEFVKVKLKFILLKMEIYRKQNLWQKLELIANNKIIKNILIIWNK